MNRPLLLIISILALSTALFAVTPRALHYQSRLTDSLGVAVNAPTDLVAVLYGSVSGTDSLWAELHPATPVSQGLLDIILGQTTPLNLTFSNPYWLEIRVNGAAMTPRVQLSSVPYARRAVWADSVTGGITGTVTTQTPLHGTGTPADPIAITTGTTSGSVAAGDHNHWGQSWSGTGNGLKLTSADSTGLYAVNSSTTTHAPALYGQVASRGAGSLGANVIAASDTCDSCYGVLGTSARGVGLKGSGLNHGVLGATTNLTSAGVLGKNSLGTATGRLGVGYYGVHGSTTGSSTAGHYGGMFLGQNLAGGVGSVSLGNNVSTFFAPLTGCGGIFAGTTCGASASLLNYQPRGYLAYYGNYVSGLSTYPVGIYAEGRTGVALVASSQSTDGIRAYTASTDTVNVISALYGYALNSNNNRCGVLGVTEAVGGCGVRGSGGTVACGVAGETDDNTGSFAGVLGANNAYYSGGPIAYGIFANGYLGSTEPKSAVVPTSKGYEALWAVESPDVEYIASGTATLQNGTCHIDLERLFVETIDSAVTLKITVTPAGPCQTLYVSQRDAKGFTVQESFNGKSDVTFDWMAIGRRKGYAQRPDGSNLNKFMENVKHYKPVPMLPPGQKELTVTPETQQQIMRVR